MIGFAGFAFHRAEDPDLLLTRMAHRFGLSPVAYQTLLYHESQFAICAVARKDQEFGVVNDHTHKVTLAWQGQLAPSTLELGCHFRSATVVARALLQYYISHGAAEMSQFNGRYAMVIWDSRKKQLILSNDLLDMRRLCWARVKGAILFGTEYKPFLDFTGFLPTPDERAMAEFIAVGYPMGNKTLIDSIQVLSPGETRIITPDRTIVDHRHIDWPEIRHSATLDQSADLVGETLQEVFCEYTTALDVPAAIPLSGGLDARTILGFTEVRDQFPSKTYTFGHPHCYDVRFAKRLARAAGTTHHFIALPDNYIQQHASEEIKLTEGEVSARYIYYAPLKARLPHGTVVWTGFLGDALSGSHLDRLDPGRFRRGKDTSAIYDALQ